MSRQPFIGIERPKGFRHQRAMKQCFRNAGELTSDERGIYVEGFADTHCGLPVHHG